MLVSSAGCGEETIDSGKVEDYLRDHARVPGAIDEVVCPDGRDAEKGDVFECTVSLKAGGEEIARVRQEDDEGTIRVIGNRQTKLPPAASDLRIIPENVEDYIRANARNPQRIVSVDCPSDVKLREGATFDCVVRFLGGRREFVEITQVDKLGNVKLTGTRRASR